MPRSPHLLSVKESLLVIIDFQERLAPAMFERVPLEENLIRLLDIACNLQIPVLVTEQYPRGLGKTTVDLAARLKQHQCSQPVEKIHFSCFQDEGFTTRLEKQGRGQLVITGIETHVCVLQTVFDALDRSFQTFVVRDCVSSRSQSDREAALARMGGAGAQIVTLEMVAFEWLYQAGTPEFKLIHKFLV